MTLRPVPSRRAPGPALSRRALLAAGLAGGVVSFARAGEPPLRIGAVLPIAGSALPENSLNLRAVGEAARMGLVLGAEDGALNGAMFGWSPEVVVANAPTPEAVERAARRLIARDGVTVLAGGYSEDQARVLSSVARESGALFLNIGATSDALRSDCAAQTFHVEASDAMYIDALLGWFVRAGFRRWHIVQDGTAQGKARSDRARAALADRHWGAEIVGEDVVAPGDIGAIAPALTAIAAARPDVVLLLLDWRSQLDFLASAAARGLEVPITGFPEPAAQTRDFYFAAARAAPRQGAGYRAALWEATLDAYGARELNARFAGRWGRPMDPAAWTAYQAVKIATESAMATGSRQGRDLAAHLLGEGVVFDVSKGIGVSFRPWDHQMRQSLFLVKVAEMPSESLSLDAMLARAALVGELPAIYMPGTDPVERLDQLGDISNQKTCR